MPVEDNGFMHLTTRAGQVAWLHASCTEWKNLFSFEIFGRDGKLHIEGLGGSYGVERLSFYRMLPQMGPPDTTIYEYPGADTVVARRSICTSSTAFAPASHPRARWPTPRRRSRRSNRSTSDGRGPARAAAAAPVTDTVSG